MEQKQSDYKFEIELDEDMVRRCGYAVEDYRKGIDETLERLSIRRVDDYTYVGDGEAKEWSRFNAAMGVLLDTSWFGLDRLKKWYYYERSEENPNTFLAEDLIETIPEAQKRFGYA